VYEYEKNEDDISSIRGTAHADTARAARESRGRRLHGGRLLGYGGFPEYDDPVLLVVVRVDDGDGGDPGHEALELPAPEEVVVAVAHHRGRWGQGRSEMDQEREEWRRE